MEKRKTDLCVAEFKDRIFKQALDKDEKCTAGTKFISTAWKMFKAKMNDATIVAPLEKRGKFIKCGDIKNGTVSYNKSSVNDVYMNTVIVPTIDRFYVIHTENGVKKEYLFAPYRDTVSGAVIMPAEFFMDLCEHNLDYGMLIDADIRLFNGIGCYICNLT